MMCRSQTLGNLLGLSPAQVPSAFPGSKVLNCGWEWGRESLPSSLSHSVTILVSTRLELKELSLPAVFETGARGGVEEEKEGVETEREKQTAERQNQEPPPQGPGPWAPSRKRGPALPGVVLSAPAPQLCVPRRVGCRISSQALAACSVFPNPPVGAGRSSVRIKVPPPLPLLVPSPNSLFLPPHLPQTSSPFRPWFLYSLFPSLLAPSCRLEGPGGFHSPGGVLAKPYFAGRP